LDIILPNFSDLIIFTFVRNTWDRIFSAFVQCRDRARTQENKIDPIWQFSDWVNQVLSKRGPSINMHFAEQYPTVYFDRQPFGIVGRFERMQDDWKSIAERIGVSESLPVLNASDHGSYVNHYDGESRRVVAEMYQREISAFGYEFGK